MSAAKAPPGKAMYVAAQADVAWLRSEQQKLHARSMKVGEIPILRGNIYGEPGA